MSAFEYASVVVSIVLALGIADILRFLADTFCEWGRRKLFWVHLVWILILLQLHVEFWWRLWMFRDFITIGPNLAFVLLGPAMLFVTTRTLLPSSESTLDLEDLYFRRKNLFFILLALQNIWVLVLSPWNMGANAELSSMAIGAFVLVMFLFGACIFSSNRILHKAVVSLIALLELTDLFAGFS